MWRKLHCPERLLLVGRTSCTHFSVFLCISITFCTGHFRDEKSTGVSSCPLAYTTADIHNKTTFQNSINIKQYTLKGFVLFGSNMTWDILRNGDSVATQICWLDRQCAADSSLSASIERVVLGYVQTFVVLR